MGFLVFIYPGNGRWLLWPTRAARAVKNQVDPGKIKTAIVCQALARVMRMMRLLFVGTSY